MRMKIYNALVNKHHGIRIRYHKMHDNTRGAKKVMSWLYLLWLNFAYYILGYKDLANMPEMEMFEVKNLDVNNPESMNSPDIKEFIKRLSEYDVISFDIFDTLIFRPFSEPTDLFYFVGEKLGFFDFYRIRRETEHEARMYRYEKFGSFEVTLADIWALIEKKTGISAEEGMRIEQECELSFCYANSFMKEVYEHLLRQGKKIIIISDMYLPEKCLAEILKKNGYAGYEKLYVSCEYDKNKGSGELFELAMEELSLAPNKVIHVGDNEYSDVKQAKKAGFASLYYPNVNKYTIMNRAYDMSPIVGGAYRGLVNTHLNCGVYKHSMEYEYGYIYGGLFAVGYCSFVHEYCKKNQIDKILFLSRDGDTLRQVYSKLYPDEKTEYVYWSRRAATKLMASSDRYDFFRRFLDHKVNQGISIEKIFDSMELEHILKKCPHDFRKDTALTSENIKVVKQFLVDHWSEVIASYEKEHAAAKQYYKKCLKGCKRVAAVDIGWAGSGAIALNHLVSKVWNLECEVVGVLAGTNTIHNYEVVASETFLQSGQLVSYMYSLAHNRDLMKKHDLNKNYNVYWELLLSSPTPQFKGFGFDKSKKQVKLQFGDYDENLEGIREVQKGILDFTEEYQMHFGKFSYMFQISGRDAYAPMLIAASFDEKYLKEIEKKFNLQINVS